MSLQIDNTSQISLASIWLIEIMISSCVLLYRWLCRCYRRLKLSLMRYRWYRTVTSIYQRFHVLIWRTVTDLVLSTCDQPFHRPNWSMWKRTHSTVNVPVTVHRGQKGKNGIIKILTMKPLSSFWQTRILLKHSAQKAGMYASFVAYLMTCIFF